MHLKLAHKKGHRRFNQRKSPRPVAEHLLRLRSPNHALQCVQQCQRAVYYGIVLYYAINLIIL